VALDGPGSSRAATNALLGELHTGQGCGSSWLRFFKAAILRSARQARARPTAAVQTSSVHYGVAGWSRRSPAPSRSGPVQTCCLRGPEADLSGWGSGGPCICQREPRRSERRDEVPTRPANARVALGPKETSWCQITIITTVIN
jgi:hypothetical protein